jgi:myo-inositol-1(or 4)-monophosphatase
MNDNLLALATDAAHRAGALLRDRPERLRFATKSTPTDVVTEMDTRAERHIVDLLLGARPDDAVLGEEGAGVGGTSGVRWVIDPIDGTVNYLYDIPAYAVSIAAEVDGASVAGVVYDVARDDTYTATRGGGAARNGLPVRCSAETDLARSLIGTGFAYDAARRAEQAALLPAVLPRVRDIRRIGSCALDLCAVASGRLDGFYEWGPSAWDVAAGRLIVTEAGGRFGGVVGEMVYAAAPGIYDALVTLLTKESVVPGG